MKRKAHQSRGNAGVGALLWLITAGILLGLIILGTDRLVWHGSYAWSLSQKTYHLMVLELAALYGLLLACFSLLPSTGWKLAAAGLIGLLFFWCHVVFLPMAAAGAYLAFLCALGHMLGQGLSGQNGRGGIGTDFLLGSAAVIVLFCLMSALGIGGIPNLRVLVGSLAAGLFLFWLRRRLHSPKHRTCPMSLAQEAGWLFETPLRRGMLAFILLAVLLQAGRMNISLDHDTLWYSVRSEYMLDNGPGGIYENMGTVSLVYTYSKGWEVLTLPLCDLPSHSFLLAFNLWLGVMVLYQGYRLARCYGKREQAFLVPFLMAGVPGIMNLGISGKTDIITLLLQLILMVQMVQYIQSRRLEHLAVSFGALLLSWTMKPTAIIFSTVIFGMSGVYLLGDWFWEARAEKGSSVVQIWKGRLREMPKGAFGLAALCLSALAGIWYRTYRFVGVPATSIFSGIFQKIGFSIRYPFLVWDLPEYGAKPTIKEEASQLLARLWGVFILPEGEEMDRVLIAWCGLTVIFFVLVWLGSLAVRKKERSSTLEKKLCIHCRMVLIPLILASIYSIYSLKKVDGNYFILLYTLVIVYGCMRLFRLKQESLQKAFLSLMLPLTLFGALMMSLSNLAWSVGFTDIQLKNPGYYNHEQQEYLEMAAKGNEKIWEVLSEDPQNRVIAFGTHPQVLSFPCNVQSYVDISSSSGNELLVESTEAFREYLDYAKTDYIYVEAGNMAEEYLGYSLLADCIREGILTDIWWENGNILGTVDLEGKPGEEAERNLLGFYENYQKKESY